jgi:hypothetical protein
MKSAGHDEGDTLVVDTIGLAVSRFRWLTGLVRRTRTSCTSSSVAEWLKDGKRTGPQVLFWVDDPGAFTLPRSGMVVYHPARNGWEEIVCAENNRSFADGTCWRKSLRPANRTFNSQIRHSIRIGSSRMRRPVA